MPIEGVRVMLVVLISREISWQESTKRKST